MSQHDYNISNQSFPAFRSDLNSVLSAINTSNSGTSRPSSAVAGTIWLDTTSASTPTLKFYDGSDDISLATLDYSANTVNWLDSSVVADLVNDTSPQLGGQLDVNGNAIGDGTNELLKFVETASAVNEVTVTNSATGNAPEISATGDDTNVDLKLTPKGSGNLVLDGIKFPNADGTSGQALQTDGSGNLSFASVGGGITMAQQWRITASFSFSTVQDINTNWEISDSTGYSSLGSSLTQSSGKFSFPETGIYLILATYQFRRNTGDRGVGGNITVTTNNSTYSIVSSSETSNSDVGGTENTTYIAHAQTIVDCTDTANVKFALTVQANTTQTCDGDTNRNYTGFTCIRLGDT